MFNFIKNKIVALIALLFASFYISYLFTVGIQIINVHKTLIIKKEVLQMNFGIITIIIFAFVPIFLWRMVMDSEIPLLKQTTSIRLLISELAIILTFCLFISKLIFNFVATSVMVYGSDKILDSNGKVTLIEVLSVAVPLIIFLYLSNKVIAHFLKKIEDR